MSNNEENLNNFFFLKFRLKKLQVVPYGVYFLSGHPDNFNPKCPITLEEVAMTLKYHSISSSLPWYV